MVGRGTSRRSFIAGVVGATVGLPLFGSTAAAQAGGVNMTAWRLDPDWGFARGPNNKTRLFSNASRQAAAHRWAIAEADALDMNLHLGSWAPAVQVLVDRTAFMQMFDAAGYVWQNPWKNVGVRILDDRHELGLGERRRDLDERCHGAAESDGTRHKRQATAQGHQYQHHQ